MEKLKYLYQILITLVLKSIKCASKHMLVVDVFVHQKIVIDFKSDAFNERVKMRTETVSGLWPIKRCMLHENN